jgi:hypothetical protein
VPRRGIRDAGNFKFNIPDMRLVQKPDFPDSAIFFERAMPAFMGAVFFY